jgi:alpha-D-ribose 1-methylphosphonate 5-phosphate C-P lyase
VKSLGIEKSNPFTQGMKYLAYLNKVLIYDQSERVFVCSKYSETLHQLKEILCLSGHQL